VLVRVWPLLALVRFDDADAAARPIAADASRAGLDRSEAYQDLALIAVARGDLAESRRLSAESVRTGAQAGAAYAWLETNWAAWAEILLGRASEGAASIGSWIRDGRFAALSPLARNHFFPALNFALAGDVAEARAVNEDFRGSVPDAQKSAAAVRQARFVDALIRARGTDTVGVAADMQAVQDDEGCWTCYRTEIALANEWMHRPERAIELHESVLDHPYTFVELNPVYGAVAMLHLGPLYEEVGDTAKAVEAYRRVVDRWGDGDAEAQRYAARARARLEAIGTGG
jgi:hypothetical protein